MPKASKEKSRKRKSNKHGPAPEYKLLTYAALGQYNKLLKLLQKRSDIDVDFYDAQGNTPLHEVNLLSLCVCYLYPVQPKVLVLCTVQYNCTGMHRHQPEHVHVQASRAGHHEVVIALLR